MAMIVLILSNLAFILNWVYLFLDALQVKNPTLKTVIKIYGKILGYKQKNLALKIDENSNFKNGHSISKSKDEPNSSTMFISNKLRSKYKSKVVAKDKLKKNSNKMKGLFEQPNERNYHDSSVSERTERYKLPNIKIKHQYAKNKSNLELSISKSNHDGIEEESKIAQMSEHFFDLSKDNISDEPNQNLDKDLKQTKLRFKIDRNQNHQKSKFKNINFPNSFEMDSNSNDDDEEEENPDF